MAKTIIKDFSVYVCNNRPSPPKKKKPVHSQLCVCILEKEEPC